MVQPKVIRLSNVYRITKNSIKHGVCIQLKENGNHFQFDQRKRHYMCFVLILLDIM